MLTQSENSEIRRAAQLLEAGSLIVIPTDTVYGVVASTKVDGALERICEAKGRDRDKPVAILVSSLDVVVRRCADVPEQAVTLAQEFWPGPLTIVLRCRDKWEGFRAPAHEAVLDLLDMVGGELYATSANRSGEPTASNAEEALEALSPHVEFAMEAGQAPMGVASTVVRVAAGGMEILRVGAVSREEIDECLNRP